MRIRHQTTVSYMDLELRSQASGQPYYGIRFEFDVEFPCLWSSTENYTSKPNSHSGSESDKDRQADDVTPCDKMDL